MSQSVHVMRSELCHEHNAGAQCSTAFRCERKLGTVTSCAMTQLHNAQAALDAEAAMEAEPAADEDADANDVVNNQADREAEVSQSHDEVRASGVKTLQSVTCARQTWRVRLDACLAGDRFWMSCALTPPAAHHCLKVFRTQIPTFCSRQCPVCQNMNPGACAQERARERAEERAREKWRDRDRKDRRRGRSPSPPGRCDRGVQISLVAETIFSQCCWSHPWSLPPRYSHIATRRWSASDTAHDRARRATVTYRDCTVQAAQSAARWRPTPRRVAGSAAPGKRQGLRAQRQRQRQGVRP